MTEYEYIENRLRDNMVVGMMHGTLRDVGRLTGGLVAAGRLSQDEAERLGNLAEYLSQNKKVGRKEWDKAVRFGLGQPLHSSFNPNSYDGNQTIGWDEKVSPNDYRIIDPKWLETEAIVEPSSWDPCRELADYIELLFEPGDVVAYCTDPFERDGALKPSKGTYTQTAKDILKFLRKGKFEDAVGTVDERAGAWIRINPFDGEGVSDANVTEYRYALIECDEMSVDEQVASYRKLELPCACIVNSGGKSAHAIVKVEANSLEEYRKRVDFLYEVCKNNGLKVDSQNRNPSRYSRMPGVIRNGRKQYIISKTCGKPTWDEWENWIKDLNDDLPPFEPLTMDEFTNPPKLAEELIESILRVNHKMCIVGPSKAGKSFLLIQLAIAIAEGGEWLGCRCRQGRVLYINLELDKNSCTHRFIDVYHALGIKPSNISKIERWNLRGRAMTLDKLTPKLIRRAKDVGFDLVIIDPIYKVLTGDENSASEMAAFCCNFDRIARECGCAIAYCHHHSKGSQGDKKSMDRASGSGVFARDPDAMIDLLGIESSAAQAVLKNKIECDRVAKAADSVSKDWRKSVGEDDKMASGKLMRALGMMFSLDQMRIVRGAMADAGRLADSMTFWRVSFTLREFATPKPKNIVFNYPIHSMDEYEILTDAQPEGCEPKPYKGKKGGGKIDRMTAFKNIVNFEGDGVLTIDDLMARMNCSRSTVFNYITEAGYLVASGKVYRNREDVDDGY